jgi:hypothetical protein
MCSSGLLILVWEQVETVMRASDKAEGGKVKCDAGKVAK